MSDACPGQPQHGWQMTSRLALAARFHVLCVTRDDAGGVTRTAQVRAPFDLLPSPVPAREVRARSTGGTRQVSQRPAGDGRSARPGGERVRRWPAAASWTSRTAQAPDVAEEVEHQRPELGGLVGQPREAEFLRYRKLTADGRHACYLDRITIGWLRSPGARRGDAMNRRGQRGRATGSTTVPRYQEGYRDCPPILRAIRGPVWQSPVIFPAHGTRRHRGQLTVPAGRAGGSVSRSFRLLVENDPTPRPGS